MIEGLKPFYNSVLRPVALILAKLNIHPDVVTLAGVAASAVAACLCAAGFWPAAALAVFAGGCLDGLDGLVARQTGKRSRFGAVWDSTGDRITEAAWFFGLLVYYIVHPAFGARSICLAFLAQAGSQMVSYVRARCEGEGIACSGGILLRPERIVVLIACLFLGPVVMQWGLGIIAALGFFTAGQRLFAARRFAGSKQQM